MQCGQRVQFVRAGSKHDHIGIAELTDPAQDFEAVDVREPDVQSDDVGLQSPDDVHPLAPVCGGMDFESRLAQHGFDKVAHVGVVLNDHRDSQVSHGPPHIWSCSTSKRGRAGSADRVGPHRHCQNTYAEGKNRFRRSNRTQITQLCVKFV